MGVKFKVSASLVKNIFFCPFLSYNLSLSQSERHVILENFDKSEEKNAFYSIYRYNFKMFYHKIIIS